MSEQSEKAIERAVCDAAARKYGMLVKKIQTGVGGSAGWPDRLFITQSGRHFWVEFKRFGKKLSPVQIVIHRRLQGNGATVYVVDNVQYGLDILAGEHRHGCE